MKKTPGLDISGQETLFIFFEQTFKLNKDRLKFGYFKKYQF